eukprot:CFRG6290T1
MSINVHIRSGSRPNRDSVHLDRASNNWYSNIPASHLTPVGVNPLGTGAKRLLKVGQEGIQDFEKLFEGNTFTKRQHADAAGRDVRLQKLGQTNTEFYANLQADSVSNKPSSNRAEPTRFELPDDDPMEMYVDSEEEEEEGMEEDSQPVRSTEDPRTSVQPPSTNMPNSRSIPSTELETRKGAHPRQQPAELENRERSRSTLRPKEQTLPNRLLPQGNRNSFQPIEPIAPKNKLPTLNDIQPKALHKQTLPSGVRVSPNEKKNEPLRVPVAPSRGRPVASMGQESNQKPKLPRAGDLQPKGLGKQSLPSGLGSSRERYSRAQASGIHLPQQPLARMGRGPRGRRHGITMDPIGEEREAKIAAKNAAIERKDARIHELEKRKKIMEEQDPTNKEGLEQLKDELAHTKEEKQELMIQLDMDTEMIEAANLPPDEMETDSDPEPTTLKTNKKKKKKKNSKKNVKDLLDVEVEPPLDMEMDSSSSSEAPMMIDSDTERSQAIDAKLKTAEVKRKQKPNKNSKSQGKEPLVIEEESRSQKHKKKSKSQGKEPLVIEEESSSRSTPHRSDDLYRSEETKRCENEAAGPSTRKPQRVRKPPARPPPPIPVEPNESSDDESSDNESMQPPNIEIPNETPPSSPIESPEDIMRNKKTKKRDKKPNRREGTLVETTPQAETSRVVHKDNGKEPTPYRVTDKGQKLLDEAREFTRRIGLKKFYPQPSPVQRVRLNRKEDRRLYIDRLRQTQKTIEAPPQPLTLEAPPQPLALEAPPQPLALEAPPQPAAALEADLYEDPGLEDIAILPENPAGLRDPQNEPAQSVVENPDAPDWMPRDAYMLKRLGEARSETKYQLLLNRFRRRVKQRLERLATEKQDGESKREKRERGEKPRQNYQKKGSKKRKLDEKPPKRPSAKMKLDKLTREKKAKQRKKERELVEEAIRKRLAKKKAKEKKEKEKKDENKKEKEKES